MVKIRTLNIEPPRLNSSCLWASDINQLRELYDSPYTGAVTTRTATLHGFKEDASNAVVFSADRLSTLNSYGYSPHPLAQYLDWIYTIIDTQRAIPIDDTARKPIILSITASNPDDLSEMVSAIQAFRRHLDASIEPSTSILLAIELNTSCPNIPSSPPPSYHMESLRPLLQVLASAARDDPSLTIGLKLPPYPDVTRVHAVVDCLSEYTYVGEPNPRSPFAFIACTNTLGGSLFLTDQIDAPGATTTTVKTETFALPSALGGLGGAQIHPLALGTVLSFSRALSAHSDQAVQAIKIIGVGGVTSPAAARRMYTSGACVVACATLLGREGVRAFEILSEV